MTVAGLLAKAERDKQMNDPKETNPKAVQATTSPPMSFVSKPVMYEVGLAMLEGALKYGGHNYRVAGAKASTYYNAAVGHLDDWWEGEDIDADSDLHHVTKAISSLMVLRDAMLMGTFNDDRPPKSEGGWRRKMKAHVAMLMGKYPDPVEMWTEERLRSGTFRGVNETDKAAWYKRVVDRAGPPTLRRGKVECTCLACVESRARYKVGMVCAHGIKHGYYCKECSSAKSGLTGQRGIT